MGAYSNPEIIVDTQTGQHFRNLQESISGTIANVAQNYSIRQKEIQRKLEENQKKLEKNFTNKKLLSREIMKVKNVIKDLKKNISNLKKHIK